MQALACQMATFRSKDAEYHPVSRPSQENPRSVFFDRIASWRQG